MIKAWYSLLALATLGVAQEPIRISVSDPRPVAAAVAEVEKRFGRAITYEDTRYVHPSDIVDVTDQVSRSPDRSKRLFGMRTSAITLSWVPPPVSVDAQIEQLLGEVIAEHTRAGNPGEFRVQAGAAVHHVIPTAFKDATGRVVPLTPPLDTRLTLYRPEESAYEAVSAVLAEVTSLSGVKIGEGIGVGGNLFFQRRVTVQARDETARDVLWRLLQSLRPDLSWKLLCDVGEKGSCAFNVHAVRSSRAQTPEPRTF
jgi:hypothetical protein